MFSRVVTSRALRAFQSSSRAKGITTNIIRPTWRFSSKTNFSVSATLASKPAACDLNTTSDHSRFKRDVYTFSTGRTIQQVNRMDTQGLLEVHWRDGLVTHYPYPWLRDNCQCETCFNAACLNRRLLLTDLDLNIKPKETQVNSVDGSSVDITWPDGHVSRFNCEWLEGRSFTEEIQATRQHWMAPTAKLWGSELQDHIPQFEFDAILNDDKTLFDWIVCLQTTGLCIVVNVPTRQGQVAKIGDRVGYLRTTAYGEVFHVITKEQPSNLAYTNGTLGLHTDLSYYQHAAGLQMLHCIRQPQSTGGENLLADGFYAAQILKENHREDFDLLTSTLVDFKDLGTDYIKYFTLSRQPVIRLNLEGKVDKIAFNHGIRDSFLKMKLEDVLPLYRALKSFSEVLHNPDMHVTYKLREGDMLCVNNIRILHGRLAYTVEGSGSGERFLEGGYMDWDELNSRRRVLAMELDLDLQVPGV